MAIQLNYKEDFSSGLKRLMTEECKTALGALQKNKDDHDRHEAVHEARKAFKKVRACLRLVRDEVDFYDEENEFFRDLGREVSEIRDASSYLSALTALEEQYASRVYKDAFNKLRKDLHRYRDELADKVFHQENRLEAVREKLRSKMEEIPGWRIEVTEFDQIRPSLKRVYKRGRAGYNKSLERGEIKDFHEWRKRIKYIRYQLDILNRLWPQIMEALEDELHDVTDLTGMDHDLHNLQQKVKSFDNPFKSDEEGMLFHTLLEQQRKYLQQHALLKGRKFYFDSASDFCDRMNQYWDAHKQEVESELPRPKNIRF